MEPVPTNPEAPRATTISVVAKRAGVGTGTVSRVINNAAGVADATRERVLQVIRDLDYHPNQAARNLSLGRTSMVAAVVPFLTHPSTVERLRGMVEVMTAHRYDLAIYDVELREQRDEQLRRLAAPGRADAVVIMSLPPGDHEIARLTASGVPLVLLDTFHPAATCVVSDNVAGGRIATRHLLELGHRRIAFVGDAPVNPYGFTSSADRCDGYRAELEAWGVPDDPGYVKQGEHDPEVAARLTLELLFEHPSPPTAIFVASDTQALGVLEGARRSGVRVPDELSVVGFDDVEVARYVGLTTVRQPLEQSGVRAAELVLAALERGSAPAPASTETLELSLVVRETTAPPRAMHP